MTTQSAMKKSLVSKAKTFLNQRDVNKKDRIYQSARAYCEKHNIDFSSAWIGALNLAKKSIACQIAGIFE